MNQKEQELMERYIYQVVRRLPRDQQDEVAMELRELIGDMYEERGGMEDVLRELGDPAEFAGKYRSSAQYLIGPAYYDTYLWFLKVVLLCTAVPVVIAAVVNGVLEADGAFPAAAATFAIRGITEGLLSLFSCCISVVGGVTILFAILERKQVKIEQKARRQWQVQDLGDNFSAPHWTPRMLSPLPHPKARISRSDSVVGIVFIAVFCALLIFAPHFFSVILHGDSVQMVPVFNLEEWDRILPLFILTMAVGLADEVFRLVNGRYCTRVMVCNIVCSAVQLALSAVVLKVLPLWNPRFVQQLQQAQSLSGAHTAEFLSLWDPAWASNILLAIFVLVTLLEVATTVYKTLRYGAER